MRSHESASELNPDSWDQLDIQYSPDTNKPITKIFEFTALLDGPFSPDFVARLTRLPKRGINIHFGRLVKKGIFEEKIHGVAFGYISERFREKVTHGIPPRKKIACHQRIHHVLRLLDDPNRPVNQYHIYKHGLLGNVKTLIPSVIKVLEVELLSGRHHRYQCLKSVLKTRFPKVWETKANALIFMECLLNGRLNKATEICLDTIRKSSRPNNNFIRDIALQLVSLKSAMFPNYPIITAAKNIYRSENESAEIKIKRMLIIADSMQRAGALSRAEQLLTEALSLSEAVPQDFQGRILIDLGQIALVKGEVHHAEGYLKKGLEFTRKSLDRRFIIKGLMAVSWLHYQKGDLAKADSMLGVAENLYQSTRWPMIRISTLRTRIAFAFDNENHPELSNLITTFDHFVANESDTYAGEILFYRLKMALKNSDPSTVIKILKTLMRFEAKNTETWVNRAIISILPETKIKNKNLLTRFLNNAGKNLKRFWRNSVTDPLPDIVGLRLKNKDEYSSELKDDFSQLFQSACDMGDPVAIAQAHIANFELFSGVGKTLQPVPHWLIHALDHPFHRNLLKRILDLEKTRTKELINNEPQNVKCQNNGQFLQILKTVIDAKNLDDLRRVLNDIAKNTLNATGGKIAISEPEEKSFEFTWGDKHSIRQSRLIDREIAKTIRLRLPIRIINTQNIQFCCVIEEALCAAIAVWNTTSDLTFETFSKNSFNLLFKTALTKWDQLSRRQRLHLEKHHHKFDIEIPFDHKDGIYGCSESIKKLLVTVELIKNSPVTVHISGETGVGKELFARAIHQRSERRQKPFVAFNCGATPDNLIESELFGHVKGAFTGAVQSRKGIFQQASGGTVFLDEIAELPLHLQVKLLRVLQERTIRPLGADEDRSINVRIISATNKDLSEEMHAGRFREDLFYRVMVLHFSIPPLRERREDIPILVKHFMREFSKQLSKPEPDISKDAFQMIMQYDWPGNIRELRNVIEVGMNLYQPPNPITLTLIRDRLRDVGSVPVEPLKQHMINSEKKYIKSVLIKNMGNVTRAAAVLGISRQGLFKKMRRYSILSSSEEANIIGEGLG
ncbi:sigma 54-interacting transcriptional regulator [bacterium]|nr:sigma 54-interacting transcriptional regulator [candidate division CSSED10-310 bacterium]